MRRSWCFAFAFVSVVGFVRESAAMTCWGPPHVLVLPSGDVPAPRNTHVRVRLQRGPLPGDRGEIPCVGPLCDTPGFGLAIHAVSAPSENIAFTEIKAPAGETTTFILTPKEPLPASSRFEVWRTDGAGKDVRLLASFTTTTELDARPPTFPPLESVSFHPYPPPPQRSKNARGRKVIVLDLFGQSSPWIGFRGPRASDETTRVGDLAFFVWSVPQGTAIDYQRPPDAILDNPEFFHQGFAPDQLFDWGSEGICYLPTLSQPYPKGKRKLGVRVVDLAGNRSEAQEREIDFGK